MPIPGGNSTILRLLADLQIGASFDGEINTSYGADLPDRVAYMAQDDLLLPWISVARTTTLGLHLRAEPPDLS